MIRGIRFDEVFSQHPAHEFVSKPFLVSKIDRSCSLEVERFLCQGRNYGLSGCIVTQQIAYLHTNALQQFHTYFVSALSHLYGRWLINNTFMVDKTILEIKSEFVSGEL